MKIWILRHGEAVDASEVGGEDAPRYLTAWGETRTREAAGAMARLGVAPERILTSPYPRALQTARITAEALGLGKKVVREDASLEPGAAPEDFDRLLAGSDEEGAGVMFVGHNPDLEEYVEHLITRRGATAGRANIRLKKGALAVVETVGIEGAGRGELQGLWGAKELIRLGGQG